MSKLYETAMKGYEYLEKKYPDRICSIDASMAIDEITYRIIKAASQKMFGC
jgi:thymidylate kinase